MSIEGFKVAIGDAKEFSSALIEAIDKGSQPAVVQTTAFGLMAQAALAQAEILEAIHQRLMNLTLKGDK